MSEPQSTIEWRPIAGFPLYEVSNTGEVRRIGAVNPLRSANHRGYRIVVLYLNARKHPRRVHRLVALAFLDTPPTPEHQVNHKDGVKDHNASENLEWCTGQENRQHAAVNGLNRQPIIRRGHMGHQTARTIHSKFREGLNRSEIARQIGVHRSMVSKVLSGRTYPGSEV